VNSRYYKVTTGSEAITAKQRSEVKSKVTDPPLVDDWARSKLKVTAGSKVNGSATPEFRTVVNVFGETLERDEMLTGGRLNVLMDTLGLGLRLELGSLLGLGLKLGLTR